MATVGVFSIAVLLTEDFFLNFGEKLVAEFLVLSSGVDFSVPLSSI